MADTIQVTHDPIVDQLNGKRGLSWVWLAGCTLGLAVLLVVGATIGVVVNSWWQERKQAQQTLNAAALIIQFNLQNGRLQMPPQLMAPSPTTPPAATGVAPAAPPAAPPGK